MSGIAEEILILARSHHLLLHEESMQFNESGLDFRVVFARDEQGTDWVLRLPRRADVFPRTKIEKLALDLVKLHCGSFQAPDWLIYSNELIAYKRLDGVPAGTIDPGIGNYIWEIDIHHLPASYHKSLGQVLAELHGVPADNAKELGLPVQTAGEARADMGRRMDAVKSAFGVGDSLWDRWQAWVRNDSLWPDRTSLIHGDLHAGHTLIDGNANVTGLIDWTEARVADPSNDFVFSYKAFGEDELRFLLGAYQDAGGHCWPGMKEHIIELAAAYPVSIAEFAMISGLAEYEQMAKDALGVNH